MYQKSLRKKASRWLWQAFVTVAGIIILASPGMAKTRKVPQDYATIQMAIDSSSSGDQVLVAGGIYSTATNGEVFPIIMKDQVSLVSADGPELTWLQANGNTSVIKCIDVESPTTIADFRIKGGSASKGGGIDCLRSSAIIKGNIITGNSATLGGGVYCDSSTVQIIDNDIIKNSGTYGGGVYNRNGILRLNDNQITENYAYGGHSKNGYAAGVYAESCQVEITGNTINNNTLFYSGWYPKAYGGGLYLNVAEGLVGDNYIQGNLIYGNWFYLIYSQGVGAGLCWLNSSNVVIDGNIITDNICRVPDKSSIYGAGIFLDYCFKPVVTDNLIAGNSLSRSGGWAGAGTFVGNSIGVIFDRNTFADNYSGAIYIGNASATFTNSIIANTNGAGIQWDGSSTVTVRYSDFWNNTGGSIVGALAGAGDTTWGRNILDIPCDQYYNIFRDPRFTADTTYHLTSTSRCIDAGLNVNPMDPDGTIPDLGAFYFDHQIGKIQISSTPSEVPIWIDGDSTGKNTMYQWDYVVATSHAITLKLPGYEIWTDTINVSADKWTYVNATLIPALDVEEIEIPALPTEFALNQNSPNPFNPTTSIGFSLPSSAEVKLKVYNIYGQEVITLIDDKKTAGNYLIEWNGTNSAGKPLASGVYFYQIRANGKCLTKKMVLLK